MNQKKWDVYVYGDVNIDIVIPGVEKFPEPGQEEEVPVMETFVGGGSALFALGIGKLGLRPVFQGEIGDDCYGEFIRRKFREGNVDQSLLRTSSTEKTGISLSFTNEHDRCFLSYRGTNAKIRIEEVDLAQAAQANHIHVTGYAGEANHDSYLKFLKKVKADTGASVSFDVGWDPTGVWKPEIYELFPFIDILFMNQTEAAHYSRMSSPQETAADFARHCGTSVIKMGKMGSIAARGSGQYRAASCQVEAVDTTGAGDSFNAGFIYGFLKGKSVEECLKCGNGCGALSVTALGGNTGFPDERRLMEFIAAQDRL